MLGDFKLIILNVMERQRRMSLFMVIRGKIHEEGCYSGHWEIEKKTAISN